jgi:polyisoprenoid-binding protein YceI
VSRRVKIAILVVDAVLIVAGLGFWYFVLRDDSPAPAELSALDDELASTTSGQANAPGESGDGLDGTWAAVTADDAFAGYRIDELYGAATLKNTVVGRTGDVSGSFTIDGDSIDDVQLEVDLTTLQTDRSRRDETLKIRGLETEQFPTATFELTEPIRLETLPAENEEIQVAATGDLTLHGQTESVTLDLTAKWSGDRISVEGSLPIVLADYDIEAISIPAFVAVDDHGTMEFLLLFERA